MSTNKDDYNHLGLTDSEVLQSREKNGINLLTPPKRPSLWKLYLEKFEDPVVRVLLVAAVFSLIISIIENEYAETIGIIAAILLATGIGFFFEYDANKKFDLLNAVNEETLVKVIRNGRVQEVPRKDIVVGDIVILETGEEIPADGELVEAISLQVNESNLTGEPVINKTIIEADFDEEATYASNLVMRGTTVVDGHGTMRVLHVGDATEIGKVARQSTEENLEPTPLNIQLTKLANLIGKIGFTVAGLAFLIFFVKDVLLYFDFGALNGWHEWLPVFERTLKYFMMAVTLIVVAVPEGLPLIVKLVTKQNVKTMEKFNILAKNPGKIPELAYVDIICTDKTGTLTTGIMTPKKIIDGFGNDVNKDSVLWNNIKANISLNNSATFDSENNITGGNSIDRAVLSLVNPETYVDIQKKYPVKLKQVFNSSNKYSAFTTKDGITYYKGAPEKLIEHCTKVMDSSGEIIENNDNDTLSNAIIAMTSNAMRCIAVTMADGDLIENEIPNDMTFLGIIGVVDPVRDEVPSAVKTAHKAGIQVIEITGDCIETAVAVATECGIYKNGSFASTHK